MESAILSATRFIPAQSREISGIVRNFQSSFCGKMICNKLFVSNNMFTQRRSRATITSLFGKKVKKATVAPTVVPEPDYRIPVVLLGEAVGCTYKGCFYLVTEDGLSVVLPSISVSSNFFPVEAIGHRQKTVSTATASQAGILFESKGIKQKSFLPWKIELLDRLLLYEDSGEADRLCLENDGFFKIFSDILTASFQKFATLTPAFTGNETWPENHSQYYNWNPWRCFGECWWHILHPRLLQLTLTATPKVYSTNGSPRRYSDDEATADGDEAAT
ncbi:hypothetical protein POM88_001300 [Heracleum sosnowskyi]|uniref:Uncharacterized protein n=1 Tax=Heracleum sosnowskyi TaxID=360622 RepID=A0AAD8JFV0_9APIA|nr:hypothetical protein POM88_001300 [Heracleum sosnowskyi]